MMDVVTKLSTVRYVAAYRRPYFATALFAMHIVPTDKVDTMAVDKYGRVYINAARISESKTVKPGQWTMEQAAGVLTHELWHWLRKHHVRAEPIVRQADPDNLETIRYLSNAAQDLEINDDHAADGLALPADALYPKTYGYPDGLLWEEYFQRLLKDAPKLPRSGGGGAAGGSGGSTQGKGSKGSGKLPEKCDCGSGAHGVRGDYELPAPGDSRDGQKTPGIGEAEGDLIREKTAADIQRAAAQAPGTIPAGWKRWADSVLEPAVVPWQRELSALVKNAVTMARGAQDYSYTKVSRRGSFAGVLMPALVRPDPDAAVVLDTSGSMGGDMLSAALREIQGILRAVGQRKVPVLCCDADVHGGVQRVSSALNIELAGGGGTDMGVGIAAAQKLKANVIIVLTDGYTPWPAEPPRGCQLVIGILEPNEQWETSYPAPKYANRVLMIRDQKGKKVA